MFMFFVMSTIIHFLYHFSTSMFIEDATYILRFQFLLFLFVYIKNRMNLNSDFSKKVVSINFSVFVINLLVGHVFGIGLEAYRFEGTSKGMFQEESCFNIKLNFFTYFLLDGN